MNTGQTLLTVCAFILLSVILQNFYTNMNNVGNTVDEGQDGIMATSINASYAEIAENLAFDNASVGGAVIGNIASLTPVASLGVDVGEDKKDLKTFDDVDDFNLDTLSRTPIGSARTYCTSFRVYYTDSVNFALNKGAPTWWKRLDMKTWRTAPTTGMDHIDTVKMSIVMGYFNF